MEHDEGFSLVEVLVSTVLMLAVTASVFSALSQSQNAFSREPEVVDMQQRLRVASDTLYKELVMAGGGSYLGRQRGPLNDFFAPIVPFRAGVLKVDPPGTFRADEITLMHVPSTAAQASIGRALPDTSADLYVSLDPGCPESEMFCGFEQGMNVLIYEESGAYDSFAIAAVQGRVGRLRHNVNPLSKSYVAGTKVVQLASQTYFLDRSASQLMHYNGGLGLDSPVVDHVVGLTFDYYGDPQPPMLKRPLSDSVGPWTTYGPKPKPLGIPSGSRWPDGENCVFVIDPVGGPRPVPRLAVLGGGAPALVRLTEGLLTDGPWCPDEASPNRFDADLLRIRKVAVTLRIEAAVSALRGPASALFANGGTSHSGSRWAPDLEARFEVSPRNLNLGR